MEIRNIIDLDKILKLFTKSFSYLVGGQWFSAVKKYEAKNPTVHCLGFAEEKKEKDQKQNDTYATYAHIAIYNIFMCACICCNGCQSPFKRDCVKFNRQVYSSGETFFHPLIAA